MEQMQLVTCFTVLIPTTVKLICFVFFSWKGRGMQFFPGREMGHC